MESPICRIDVEMVSFYHTHLLHSLDKLLDNAIIHG
jgi:hypothetical protein